MERETCSEEMCNGEGAVQQGAVQQGAVQQGAVLQGGVQQGAMQHSWHRAGASPPAMAGLCLSWAPVPVSAPSPAEPGWAAGPGPGGNAPEGGGWRSPRLPHFMHRCATVEKQRRSGLWGPGGDNTRARATRDRLAHGGLHDTKATFNHAKAAPLPMPQLDRQHPGTKLAAPCVESCSIPPWLPHCAITHGCLWPRVRPCQGKCWQPRVAGCIPHVPYCCRGECKSAAGPAENNKLGWVSAWCHGAVALSVQPRCPVPQPPGVGLCSSQAWRVGYGQGWNGRGTQCCHGQRASAQLPCGSVVTSVCVPWMPVCP